MITKHTFEVWAKDSHVFATVEHQSFIRKLHRHVDRFLVMRCFATCEDANVFLHKPWVYLHVMNVQTSIAIPAWFGKETLSFTCFVTHFKLPCSESVASAEWTFCCIVCTSRFFSLMICMSSVWLNSYHPSQRSLRNMAVFIPDWHIASLNSS